VSFGLKIAHISDVHIRNQKMHDEYRAVFKNLCDDLRVQNVDHIVLTGDMAHTKLQISPDFVKLFSEFLDQLSQIAPVHLIRGNHDLNLMNRDRTDALRPVVDMLADNPDRYPITLYSFTGLYPLEDGFCLFVQDIADPEPKKLSDFDPQDDAVIGLYHGAVRGCETDQGFKMVDAEGDLSGYDGCSFIMLGDIHKQQFMDKERRVAYAGSLIQQNFGEQTKKGYLLWEIVDKDTWTVQFREVKGSRGFYTIVLDEPDQDPDMIIPDGARIRVQTKFQVTVAEQRKIKQRIIELYKPHDVLGVMPTSEVIDAARQDTLKARPTGIQSSLLEDFLDWKGVDGPVREEVMRIDSELRAAEPEATRQGAVWQVKKIGWSDLFNYGSGNVIDLDKIPGLTGIFAPNASGKSSIFDVFLETIFDRVSKDVPRNIDLINDNKDSAAMVAEVEVGGLTYTIERTIERLKYGQRKGEQKEWGKTSLDLWVGPDKDEKLTGQTRGETERLIRASVGSFEEFMLTSMLPQGPLLGIPGGADLIMCKETDRKKILLKFLGLDLYDALHNKAKPLASKAEESARALQVSADTYAAVRQRVDEASAREHELVHELGQVEDLHAVALQKAADMKAAVGTQRKRPKHQIEAELAQLEKKIDGHQQELSEAVKAQIAAKAEVEIAEIELASLDKPTLLERLKTETETRKAIQAVNVRLGSLRRDESSAKKKLRILDEVPCAGAFPSCSFLLDAFEAKETLPALEQEIEHLAERAAEHIETSDIPEKLERVAKIESQLSQSRERHSRSFKRISDLDSKIDDLQSKVAGMRLAIESAPESDDAWEEIAVETKRVEQLSRQMKKLTDELTALRARQIRNHEDLQTALAATVELTAAQLRSSALQVYLEATGKHGIPLLMLSKTLPTINAEVNRILSGKVKFDVSLEYDESEQTLGMYMRYADYGRRNIGLASGAERFIASLAIRAALLNVSSLPRSNVFVIDEGFGKLDVEHMESINQMLTYLKTRFEHVIIISHVEALKDVVDNIVEITSDEDGYAHVEVC
jgi:DNA repair exonuclease SbcCD ATPase subunit